jgi:hypothetical protein
LKLNVGPLDERVLSLLLAWLVWRVLDEGLRAELADVDVAVDVAVDVDVGSTSMVVLSSRLWLVGYAWAERKEKSSKIGAVVGTGDAA